MDEYVNALAKLADMSKIDSFDRDQEEYVMKTNREGVIKLSINSQKNIELFDYLLEKLQSARYAGVNSISHFYNELSKGRESFIRIYPYEQAVTLLQILKFFRCNAELCNLKQIEVLAVGKVTINKDITDTDVSIVYQSPCGLTEWEKRV